MISACTILYDGIAAFPERQSIRTFGSFEGGMAAGGRRPPGSAPGSTGEPERTCGSATPGPIGATTTADSRREASCASPTFQLCCADRSSDCLVITPVPELTDALADAGERFRSQRVMVVGMFEEGKFLFWDFQHMADFTRPKDEGLTGLRAVVAAAGAEQGRLVRVRGRFRGRNLFQDLPEASRRNARDWVLSDQGAALWVTGRAPKGEGFSLDPDQRSATDKWVEVEGKVDARDGVVYLKATRVSLVGPRP
jgi:hypothetical protein